MLQEFTMDSTEPYQLDPYLHQSRPQLSAGLVSAFTWGLLLVCFLKICVHCGFTFCSLGVYFGSTLSLICLGVFSAFKVLLPIRVYSLCTLGLLWVHSEFLFKFCSSKPRVNLEETLEINLGISWGLLSVMFGLIGTVYTLFISTSSLILGNSFGKLQLTI